MEILEDLQIYESGFVFSLESSSSSSFLFSLFFYVKLERGDEAYLGKAQACCGVEDVRREGEFGHSGDAV